MRGKKRKKKSQKELAKLRLRHHSSRYPMLSSLDENRLLGHVAAAAILFVTHALGHSLFASRNPRNGSLRSAAVGESDINESFQIDSIIEVCLSDADSAVEVS